METIETLQTANSLGLQMLPVAALSLAFDLSPAPTEAPVASAQAMPAPAADHERFAQLMGTTGERHRQGFRLGKLGLMIRYEEGSELTDMPKVHVLPNTIPWFSGITNLHGMLVPVFDLAAYLGTARNHDVKPMLLVLSHGANAAAIVIDGLPQRLRWSAEEQIADVGVAPQRLAQHVRATCLIDDQLWFDLDCTSLLNDLEQALQSH